MVVFWSSHWAVVSLLVLLSSTTLAVSHMFHLLSRTDSVLFLTFLKLKKAGMQKDCRRVFQIPRSLGSICGSVVLVHMFFIKKSRSQRSETLALYPADKAGSRKPHDPPIIAGIWHSPWHYRVWPKHIPISPSPPPPKSSHRLGR